MIKTQNMMPYDFMVKHTPQEAWIKGKGVLLWLAFFFSEIGAGIYLVSLFLNLSSGCILGWILTLLVGGGLHVAYLGKPLRVFYMFLKPGKSELSRGLWVILLFAIFGFIQLAPVVFKGASLADTALAISILVGILCVLIIAHGFLTMSIIRALPVWNSSMMVPLALVSGVYVGSQVVSVLGGNSGLNLNATEVWVRWTLFGYMGCLAIFLMGAAHASTAAQVSIKQLLAGKWSLPFYGGVVAVGLIIPLIITAVIWGSDTPNASQGLLWIRCLCAIVGDLMMRYGIMKNASYAPLI